MHCGSHVAIKSFGARRPHRRHAFLLAQLGVLVLVALTTALFHSAPHALAAEQLTVTVSPGQADSKNSYMFGTVITLTATLTGCDSVAGSLSTTVLRDVSAMPTSATLVRLPLTPLPRKATIVLNAANDDESTGHHVASVQFVPEYKNEPTCNPVLGNRIDYTIVAPPLTTQVFNLTSSTNPSVAGQSVTFSATLLNSDGGCFASFSACPTGTVTFLDGTTAIGTFPLIPIPQEGTHGSPNQFAFVTTTALGAGTHSITAAYGGDSRFAGSTSSPLVQVVTAAPTTAAASPASAAAAPSQASTTPSTTTTAGTTTTATAPSTASQPGGGSLQVTTSVTYPAGWNLVAGCGAGMPQAAATLYTFQAQDTDYESSPNTNALTTGQGYWAFFAQQATVGLPAGCAGGQSVRAPGGRYIMLGNSTQSSLTLHGLSSGDQALTYNASTGQYTDITGTPSLAPGQGAWVYVATDATLSLG